MGRFLAGVASALLLMTAGIFIWRARADAGEVPPPPLALAASDSLSLATADPPQASEKTREEKRFGRYDKNKDGGIAADEYLQSRRKAFAKLDVNGDGRLGFDEYATKTILKFRTADKDRSGILTAAEFLTTRVVRAKPKSTRCPPPPRAAERDEDEG